MSYDDILGYSIDERLSWPRVVQALRPQHDTNPEIIPIKTDVVNSSKYLEYHRNLRRSARRAPRDATRKPIIGGKSNIAEILRKRNVSGIGDVRALFRLGRATRRPRRAADLIDATPSRDRAERDAAAP